ncbi:biosynthetic-type acetolactate synthase large subunit [Desulfatibacillum aliphaticivorans]|uniref:biosynthetic-type acetolactate synthase large subunit n=1 Tax=Desulfatibacillum aliphaticivorans TaxID=218208 RepID=UPI000484D33D|nr:biosynthetic-type acetolactate synthase large subunit [Desulfatibacillum aliphaticivorans]
MKLSGAEILLKMLESEGVDSIFGYPGGVLIGLYDEMAKSNIRHYLVRHEQGAVHAADGYARISGKVGVCLVTSGPGATNTVTGIASAYCDSIPMVVLTGQVPTNLIGNDAFQEVDIVGITRPCTKHNYLVKDVNELADTIREAFHIARSGRPGPVLIDLPKDVLAGTANFKQPKGPVTMRSYNPTVTPNTKQLTKVIKELMKAKKPLIMAGGGIISSNASQALTDFARKLQIPVTTTLMGLGAFPGSDDLSLGMIGMHGTYRANMSTGDCDVLLGVGVRFDDRVTGKTDTFASQAKIIHVDIDPTSIRKNVPVSIPVVGDCKATLDKLNELLTGENLTEIPEKRAPWLKCIAEWKAAQRLAYDQTDVIKPQYVVERLCKITEGKAIISTEVGQNQMWAAQFYDFDQPNRFVTSGGLGVMGFGLPAAIGAQVAAPNDLVVDVAGDGSIQMNIQELGTAMQHKLPVKVVILNNGYLGMVRQWQELFFGKRYCATQMDVQPDFVKLAEAYGATGLRATKPEEVDEVLKKGLAAEGPVIMDFVVEREECVYPMVPAGAPITEMLLV